MQYGRRRVPACTSAGGKGPAAVCSQDFRQAERAVVPAGGSHFQNPAPSPIVASLMSEHRSPITGCS